jgi:predicted Zn-dependent protease
MSAAASRRGFLRTACRHCAGAALFGFAGVSAAQSGDEPLPAVRFKRPAADTDEGGLWAMMDREETRLRRSSFVIRDEALNQYMRELVCRLGGEHCSDVRVHLVRTPLFNASMAPNGMMQVWSGLLLRVENEAQLAAVIGHELGHYLESHVVERLRDLKGKAALATFLSVFGVGGALAGLGVLGAAAAFSRDQERRADRIGLRLMRRAGYEPREAAAVWDNLLAELKITGGEDAGKRSAMFASHPPAADRRDELLRMAGDGGGTTGDARLAELIAPHRFEWLQEEVKRGQFEESLVLFERLLRKRPDDAQVLFARGEVYRLRGGSDDLQLATADLGRAAAMDGAPAQVHRSLGLVFKRRAEPVSAIAAFEKYLAVVPDAGDAGLIKTYLTELKP